MFGGSAIGSMVFESIEKLKSDWTDKYVVTDEARPELRRFSGLTGTVKTVNMSGRCLVEFEGRANIGWYDIDPNFLKVITEPLKKPDPKEAKAAPKAETKKPADAPKAAAPAAKPSGGVADILAAARAAAKPAAATTAKPASSTADILAAARAKASTAPSAEAAKPAEKTKAGPATAKPADAKSMSVTDILAAARGKATAAPAAPAAKKEAPPPAPAPEVVEESPPPPKPDASSSGSKRGAFATVEEIVAYCRKVDTKG
jgi:hypothetical protein